MRLAGAAVAEDDDGVACVFARRARSRTRGLASDAANVSKLFPAGKRKQPANTWRAMRAIAAFKREAQEEAVETLAGGFSTSRGKLAPVRRELAAALGGEAAVTRPASSAAVVTSDHDDFGLNPSKIMNVIEGKSLKRDAGGQPVSPFPHPATGKEGSSSRRAKPAGMAGGRRWRVVAPFGDVA